MVTERKLPHAPAKFRAVRTDACCSGWPMMTDRKLGKNADIPSFLSRHDIRSSVLAAPTQWNQAANVVVASAPEELDGSRYIFQGIGTARLPATIRLLNDHPSS